MSQTPAYIKVRLIDTLAKRYELTQIHPKIAYLTGDKRLITHVLKIYEVRRGGEQKPSQSRSTLL